MCAQVCGWARTVNSKADLHSGAVTFSVKVSFLWILPLHSLYSNNGKKSMFSSQQIQGFTIIWKKCWVFELVRPDTWLNSFSSVSPLHKLPNLSKSKSCLIIHTKRNQSGRILDLGYLGCFCYGGVLISLWSYPKWHSIALPSKAPKNPVHALYTCLISFFIWIKELQSAGRR